MTAPDAPVRARRYPLVVEQALGSYVVENFDVNARLSRVKNELAAVVRDALGVDATIQETRLTPATANGETWFIAVLAVMFDNITKDELDRYADALSAEVGGDDPKRTLIEGPDFPETVVFVPTREWLAQETADARDLAEKSRKMLNADGTLNTSAVSASAQALPPVSNAAQDRSGEMFHDDGSAKEADELF